MRCHWARRSGRKSAAEAFVPSIEIAGDDGFVSDGVESCEEELGDVGESVGFAAIDVVVR